MTLLWDTRPGTFVTPVSPFSFRNAAALLHEHTTNWRKFFVPWNERESVINHLLFSLSNNRPSSFESQKTIISLLASPQATRFVLQAFWGSRFPAVFILLPTKERGRRKRLEIEPNSQPYQRNRHFQVFFFFFLTFDMVGLEKIRRLRWKERL